MGREDSLEKEMATHSSILAWRIPWMEEPGGLQSMGCKESHMTEQLHFHFPFTFRGDSLSLLHSALPGMVGSLRAGII